MLWYIYDDKACFEFLIFMQIKTAFLLHCRGTDIKKEKNKFFSMDINIQFTFLSSTSPLFMEPSQRMKKN